MPVQSVGGEPHVWRVRVGNWLIADMRTDLARIAFSARNTAAASCAVGGDADAALWASRAGTYSAGGKIGRENLAWVEQVSCASQTSLMSHIDGQFSRGVHGGHVGALLHTHAVLAGDAAVPRNARLDNLLARPCGPAPSVPHR